MSKLVTDHGGDFHRRWSDASATVGLVVLVALVAAPSGWSWTWPLAGDVLRPYSLGPDPYAAGQHRGVDVAGGEGEAVRAPAAGVVSFAGSVPGSGRTVTIQGAGYAVSVTHLAAITTSKGATIAEGAVIGVAGLTGDSEWPSPYVHLGIRTSDAADGYVDPHDAPAAARRAPSAACDPAGCSRGRGADPTGRGGESRGGARPAIARCARRGSCRAAGRRQRASLVSRWHGSAPAPRPAPASRRDALRWLRVAPPPRPLACPPARRPAAGYPDRRRVVRGRRPSRSSVQRERRPTRPRPARARATRRCAVSPGVLARAARRRHRGSPPGVKSTVTSFRARRAAGAPASSLSGSSGDIRAAGRASAGRRRGPSVDGSRDRRARRLRRWRSAVPVLALVLLGAGCVGAAFLARPRRIDRHGALLRHDADLLRELDPAHRARLHDDRGGHPGPKSAAAWRRDVLPDRRRRARGEGRPGRRGAGALAAGVRRSDRSRLA